jgi:hypothetical protein
MIKTDVTHRHSREQRGIGGNELTVRRLVRLQKHAYPRAVAPGLLGTSRASCIVSFACNGSRSFTLSFRDFRLLSFHVSSDWG